MKRRLLLFLTGMCMVANIYAQPTITTVSGTVRHGQSIDIIGNGFGTKVTPAPAVWDAVENQSAYVGLNEGDPIPTSGNSPWTSNGSTWGGEVQYTEQNNRGQSTAHFKAQGHKFQLGWPQSLGGKNPPSTQTKLYATWWYKPSIHPNEHGGSNKFVRIWDRDGSPRAHVTWTQEQLFATDSSSSANDPQSGPIGWTSWGTGQTGEWNRMEVWIDADNLHLVRAFVNGKKLKTSNSSLGGEIEIDYFGQVDSTRGFNIAMIGFDNSGTGGYENMINELSEIYIDVTRARVEIGNAPTWAACTHREIQVPSAWASGSATVTVNQGTFTQGQTAYLYVVDPSGGVNTNGYPINIEGGNNEENLALNKTVTVSSEPEPANPGTSAVDDIVTTRWSASGGYPQWLEVDLGDIYNINASELVCYEDRAYQFTVDVKTTVGGVYAQIVDRSGNTQGGGVASPIRDDFIQTEARYVRITVTGADQYSGSWTSLKEFRVFGASTPINLKTGTSTTIGEISTTKAENPEEDLQVFFSSFGLEVYYGSSLVPGGNEKALVGVYDMSGQLIQQVLTEAGSLRDGIICNSSQWDEGLYIVRILTAKTSLSRSVMLIGR